MGSESASVLPEDGESPVRQVLLDPFYISKFPVTNSAFAEFVRSTGYATEAGRFGWSFVFGNHLPDASSFDPVVGTPWWRRVPGTIWLNPEGNDSSVADRLDHPVVHVSWNDALAYCEWRGLRLPTEAEWEFAARGGREQQMFPWGDELTPGGKHMCNVWQGTFPVRDSAEDGFSEVAPVDTFEANDFGLFTMIGNTWEWCADYFGATWHAQSTRRNPAGPTTGSNRVLKGGSYLCHESYCYRYRNSARSSNSPFTSAGNIGFRTARDVS